MAVVDKPWDGDAGRFTDEQYQASCALDRKSCGGEWASKPPKSRCSLPYKEPNGDINKNGVHAAAGRIGQVSDACSGAIASAKAKLRSAYKTIGDPVPSSLGGDSAKSAELESVVREFVVIPGVARHGEARRWMVMDDVLSLQIRDDSPGDGYLATLEGHFAVFNRWTEINSFFEGRFLESLAPGAFKKTFAENMKGMRCLFQHGRDPQIGMKPLDPIREVGEDDTGAKYGVPMIDTSYNRDLLPVLRDGLCGASFRFQVMREEVNSEPGKSAHNPDGIEERLIKECKVREFGPVTFPAYEDATADVRSLEDWWHGTGDDADPARMAELISAREDLLVRFVERSGTEDEAEVEAESTAAGERSDENDNGSTAPSDDPRKRRPVPSARRGHSPRLPGAASALRTTTDREEPSWRL